MAKPSKWQGAFPSSPLRGWTGNKGYGYVAKDSEGNPIEWWSERTGGKLGSDPHYDRSRAESLVRSAMDLERAQSEVHTLNLYYGQMYDNRQLALFEWGTNNFVRASMRPLSTANENHAAVCLDMMVAQVGKNRPKATPICRGANFKRKRAAKKLDKFLWGTTVNTNHFAKAKNAFKCALTYGFGGIRFCYEDGAIEEEPIFPDDILVDQREVSATGRYSHLFHRRVLPVERVAHMFNLDADKLMADTQVVSGVDAMGYRAIGKGWVLLVEGWLKAEDGMPGRYVAATNGRLLKDEAWTEEWVPFVFYHYNEPISGRSFYQPPLLENLLPYQIRYNELTDIIRNAQDLSRAIALIPKGSGIDPNVLYAKQLRVLQYNIGFAPTFEILPTVARELYEERARIKEEMTSRCGLGQYSNATLPSGNRLDSSKAVREANAIQDDRLVDPAQRYEEFHLNCYKLMMKIMGKYATKDGDGKPKTVLWQGGGKVKYSESIDWSELDLSDEKGDFYTLQIEPSSAFSMMPSAMLDTLEDQLARGLITPDDYKNALATPDTEAQLNVSTASARNIEVTVDRLLDGKYTPPKPEQDLVTAVQRITISFLSLDTDYDIDSVPMEIYAMHRDWLSAAQAILDQAANANANGQIQPAPMDPMMASNITPDMQLPNPLGSPMMNPAMAPINPNLG